VIRTERPGSGYYLGDYNCAKRTAPHIFDETALQCQMELWPCKNTLWISPAAATMVSAWRGLNERQERQEQKYQEYCGLVASS
jgi:hypothetical protein